MDVDDVMDLLLTEMKSVIAGIVPPIPKLQVGKGYPTQTALLDVARNGGAGVALFDRAAARNMTRWMPFVATEAVTATGVAAALGGISIDEGTEQTLVLSGAVVLNDAIVMTAFQFGPLVSKGASVVAVAGDTLQTLATKLAAAINADPVLSGWMSAVAENTTVLLTGLGPQLRLSTATGNIRTQQIENARFRRELQIIIWTNNEITRKILGKALFSDMARIYAAFGLQASDGTWLRVTPFGDILNDANIQESLYRRDILIDAEYGVTAQQLAYDILSTQPSLTVQ